jgi:DNA-binding transcriptional regulator YdaS (Cro superfamily)
LRKPERYAFLLSNMADEALDLVKDKLGGNAGIAAKLGDLTPQAVSQWKQVPPARVLDIERLTGISRHRLRPDVFGKSEAAA